MRIFSSGGKNITWLSFGAGGRYNLPPAEYSGTLQKWRYPQEAGGVDGIPSGTKGVLT